MAIAVSRPEAGRLTVQKLSDYKLHLTAAKSYLTAHAAIKCVSDLPAHRLVGYISDMIFDKELDYLTELGLGPVSLASNSVSVQLNLLRQGSGIGVVHDFARFAAPELQDILANEISFTRSFWLIRHADDAQVVRLNRFSALLAAGMKRTVSRLESQREGFHLQF
jgi:DNA-binding transcriptional LysR family regulator